MAMPILPVKPEDPDHHHWDDTGGGLVGGGCLIVLFFMVVGASDWQDRLELLAAAAFFAFMSLYNLLGFDLTLREDSVESSSMTSRRKVRFDAIKAIVRYPGSPFAWLFLRSNRWISLLLPPTNAERVLNEMADRVQGRTGSVDEVRLFEGLTEYWRPLPRIAIALPHRVQSDVASASIIVGGLVVIQARALMASWMSRVYFFHVVLAVAMVVIVVWYKLLSHVHWLNSKGLLSGTGFLLYFFLLFSISYGGGRPPSPQIPLLLYLVMDLILLLANLPGIVRRLGYPFGLGESKPPEVCVAP